MRQVRLKSPRSASTTMKTGTKSFGDKSLMADVNLRYCMAVTMLDGKLTFDASHDAERMQRADVVAMGRRIEFRGPTPGLERFATEVELDAAGKTCHAVRDRNVLGRYENPMTRAEVEDKVLELMRPLLPASQVREVIAMTAKIEQIGDIRDLVRAMTKR